MPAVMAVIFAFSAMPGEESGDTSGALLMFVAGAMEKLGHLPFSADQLAVLHHVIRKIAHFTEFAILGVTTVIALYNKNRSRSCNYLLPIIIAVLYACSDEFHQLFVPGRAGTIKDVLVDSLGALTGVTLTWLWFLKHYSVKRAVE